MCPSGDSRSAKFSKFGTSCRMSARSVLPGKQIGALAQVGAVAGSARDGCCGPAGRMRRPKKSETRLCLGFRQAGYWIWVVRIKRSDSGSLIIDVWALFRKSSYSCAIVGDTTPIISHQFGQNLGHVLRLACRDRYVMDDQGALPSASARPWSIALAARTIPQTGGPAHWREGRCFRLLGRTPCGRREATAGRVPEAASILSIARLRGPQPTIPPVDCTGASTDQSRMQEGALRGSGAKIDRAQPRRLIGTLGPGDVLT